MTSRFPFFFFFFTDYLSRLPKQDGSSNQSSLPGSRRSLIHKSEKMSSPRRLFLKFQREQADEFHDKPSKEPHFTSTYSVTMGPSEHKDFLSVDSPVSSVDSDLYDPQLDKVKVNVMEGEEGSGPGVLSRERTVITSGRIGTIGGDGVGLGGQSAREGLSGNILGARGMDDHSSLTGVMSGSKAEVTSYSSGDLELGMGEFERLSNLEPDSQNDESGVNTAPHLPTKFHLKMMETQRFSPHFSDNEQSDSDAKDPPPLSISSTLSSSLTSLSVVSLSRGRRGSVGEQTAHIPQRSDTNNHTKLKESVSDPGPGNGVQHVTPSLDATITTTSTTTPSATRSTTPVVSSSTFSSLFTTTLDQSAGGELSNSHSVVPDVSSLTDRSGSERPAPSVTSSSFPRRNSVTSGSVVSGINGSQDGGSGYGSGAVSGNNDLLTSSSGLKWDLRSSSSSSPKNIDEWSSVLSAKSEGRQSPTKSEKDQDNSPKSDRDSRESYSRSTSPKVPPLKIIIPPKASTSTASMESVFVKSHSSKHALPYVINPTQEQEAAATSSLTNQAIPVTTVSQDIAPTTSSPASSRPSSRESNTASKDSDKPSIQDTSKEDKVSVLDSTWEESVEGIPCPPGEEKEQDKDSGIQSGSGKDSEKEKGDEDKEGTQRSTRTLRSHTHAALQQKHAQDKHQVQKGDKPDKGDKQEKPDKQGTYH